MTDKITTGGEVESYCTKCRLTLDHIIVAMVDGTIVKVKCKTCGSTHRYKGMPMARSTSSARAGRVSKSAVPVETVWENAVEQAKGEELPYDMAKSYRTGDLIAHNVFGRGVIQKTSFNKCSVLFRDKERMLVTANT